MKRSWMSVTSTSHCPSPGFHTLTLCWEGLCGTRTKPDVKQKRGNKWLLQTNRQWIKEMRDERCLFFSLRLSGWGAYLRSECDPSSSTSCSRQQLSVPESHSSWHCFVITVSALFALSRKESPPRQRLNVYLVSWVPDTSHVKIKRELFAFLQQLHSRDTFVLFKLSTCD